MTEIEKINNDLKKAMIAKDSLRVNTLRMLISEFKYAAIEKKGELSETEIQKVIKKAIKSRKDSFEQYRQAGRDDLAVAEEAEMKILEEYAAVEMSEEELRKLITTIIHELQAKPPKDFGKVVQRVISETQGKADGKLISSLVKELLQ